MARLRKGEVNEQKMDMTPMIDCIFQLIIFFMCSIKFKSLEGKLASYLPKDVGLMNTQVANPNMDEIRIKLVYDESQTKLLKTRIELKKTGNEPQVLSDWDSLFNEVKRHFDNLKASGIDKDFPFIIDPESKIPMQAVIHALDSCRRAGIEDIRFAAKSPVTDPLKGLGEKSNKWTK